MKLPEITQLILAVAGLVSAVGVPLIAVLQWKNKKAIREVHLSLNSRLDQLVKSESDTARLEGHADGVVQGKAEGLKS